MAYVDICPNMEGKVYGMWLYEEVDAENSLNLVGFGPISSSS